MARYSYIHLDVFTHELFGGNQLAVFPAPQGLSDITMQAIAHEMNFAETTFVFPPSEAGTDIRLRIFTPFEELPMAGHPTIGTAFALAYTGFIATKREKIIFEEGVGPIPVALTWKTDGLSFAWMTQLKPQFGRTLEPAHDAAVALGLSRNATAQGIPVQEVSCGVPFLFVPLASRAAVDNARADRDALIGLSRKLGSRELPVFLFSTEDAGDGATAYSRMFAPGLGVVEDPATGGASGPLGSYLVRYGVVSPDRAGKIISLQGVRMRRPSRIHIDIGVEGGEITLVKVGGEAVVAGEGTLFV